MSDELLAHDHTGRSHHPQLAVCCSDLARGLHLPCSLCAYPASVSAPVCSGILLAQSFAPISVYTDGFTQVGPWCPPRCAACPPKSYSGTRGSRALN